VAWGSCVCTNCVVRSWELCGEELGVGGESGGL